MNSKSPRTLAAEENLKHFNLVINKFQWRTIFRNENNEISNKREEKRHKLKHPGRF